MLMSVCNIVDVGTFKDGVIFAVE